MTYMNANYLDRPYSSRMSLILGAASACALTAVLATGAPQAAFADEASAAEDGQVVVASQVEEPAASEADSAALEAAEQVVVDAASDGAESVADAAAADCDAADAAAADAPDVEAIDSVDEASCALDTEATLSASFAVFDYKIYAGENMYETAAAEAIAAYANGSDSAIIVGPGDAWVDALSASGLAATRGPILFTDTDYVPDATKSALRQLGVKSVVIIGGTAAVGQAAEDELAREFTIEARLAGENCYGTQMAIYEYGLENNLWRRDMVIVATGTWYADALSISPVAYANAAPIFLGDASGNLSTAQIVALAKAAVSNKFKDTVIVGGTAAISEETEDIMAELADITGGTSDRLWGANQFSTSIAIAQWAVETQGFSWDNLAYTTGSAPYDALAGSVLQGKTRSVLLLVNNITDKTVSVAAKHADEISTVRFFGGDAAVSPAVRNAVINSSANSAVTYVSTGIRLERFAELEYAVLADGSVASYAERLEAINPDNYAYGTSDFYQFAVLNDGYTGQITAEQLNRFINTYGSTGMLAGQGQAFIDAAKMYDINEVYLLAHAILESGWGKSTLARGQVEGYEGYYNFFGFGAYDSDPGNGGGSAAKNSGWDTPYKAIVGAGETIAKTYLNNRYNQNTLYKMRWNYNQAASTGSAYFQYATSISWPNSIAHLMAQCYSYLGVTPDLRYEIPEYE